MAEELYRIGLSLISPEKANEAGLPTESPTFVSLDYPPYNPYQVGMVISKTHQVWKDAVLPRQATVEPLEVIERWDDGTVRKSSKMKIIEIKGYVRKGPGKYEGINEGKLGETGSHLFPRKFSDEPRPNQTDYTFNSLKGGIVFSQGDSQRSEPDVPRPPRRKRR